MTDFYQVIISGQDGQHAGQSQAPSSLRRLVSCSIARASTTHESSVDQAFDKLVHERLAKYRRSSRRNRRLRSRLEEYGVEIDATKCYLRGLTVEEIANWLEQNKNIKISKSSVGRFCTKLFNLGIFPLRTTQQIKEHGLNPYVIVDSVSE